MSHGNANRARDRGAQLASALALLSSACMSTPTPLAPGLSGSVGAPNRGVLTDGALLPERGPGFVRYRPLGPHYWGRPELVHAIENAAAEVAQRLPGGAPLAIGDLSARGGGRITGHDSHRSGRDVDLLFYVTTPEGAPVPSPGFIRFEADGLARIPDSKDYLRFDVEREWLLLRDLLTAPEIGVQFLFVSREMEALLIHYARARGEPDALVWHAETVMLEPSDSMRHDDHVHLRIACGPNENVSGCTGGGPRWEWLPGPSGGERPFDVDLSAIAAEDPLTPASQASASSASGFGGG